MFQDIRWRIAIPYVILILVVMGGLTIYLSRTTRDAQLEALRNSLVGQARTLSASLQPSFDNVGAEGLDQQANLWSELLRARVTIIGTDGTVLGESDEDRELMNNHLNRPEVQQALVRGEGSSIRFSRTVGYEMMYVAIRVVAEERVVGIARVALPLRQIEATLASLRSAVPPTFSPSAPDRGRTRPTPAGSEPDALVGPGRRARM